MIHLTFRFAPAHLWELQVDALTVTVAALV